MPRSFIRFGMVAALAALLLSATARGDDPALVSQHAQSVDYLRDIRPILARSCFSCHGADPEHRKAKLRLDQREGATRALDDGNAAIVPGDPDASALVFRIGEEDETARMPPPKLGPRLKPAEVELLTSWVRQGAPYVEHWAYRPPEQRSLPLVTKPDWASSAIDRWILASLDKAGLKPSPPADRAILLRRASLDLRGLPATPEELKRFLDDESPTAYEKAIDRLLADPAFGERWARVWLDLARYADSAGYGSDPLRPYMWRYRDWLIDALNLNMPYDQFATDQLAGDLLPNPTLDQRLATAFHRNTMTNTEGGTDDEEFRVAAIKDRVDTTGLVFMGLTFGCAKCHSHKYDPITNKEYYQLYAFFNQTADADQPDERPTMPAPTREQHVLLARIDAQIAALQWRLDEPTPDLEADQSRWETGLRAPVCWSTLVPVEVHSESGRAFEICKDGVVRATSANGNNDVITMVSQAPAASMAALRLETMPGPDLPQGHPGNPGAFVVSRLALEVGPEDPINSKAVGRFVRIELPGKQKLLSLAEVQVFHDTTNVATGGEATQSSTDYEGSAQRAVDGNPNGHYFEAQSTTHTSAQDDPWWEVKLPVPQPIDRIVVWNRTDGGLQSRLSNFRVQILDDDRNTVWETSVADPPYPSRELPVSNRRVIAFASAAADHQQPGFPVETLLRPSADAETGWAIGPQHDKPHAAVLAPVKPISIEPHSRFTITIEHKYKAAGLTLDRFRLLVTSDAHAARRAAVPGDILAILDLPGGDRTGEQHASLARYYRSIAPALRPLRDEMVRLQKSKPMVANLPVMAELPPDKKRTTRILRKGNFLDPTDEVEPGVPAFFHPMEPNAPRDRLGLARWLFDERNTLTARVAINRIWAQLFGIGLVETEEDFGTQGELPSHPELLDWLAMRYRDLGWNTKALVREIVTSSTYRQSSVFTSDRLRADPRNRLLSRAPRVRLDAEMVRDQALALSGLLSRKLGGPSVFPPQPEGLWQAAFNGERTWATSAGDDRWRRGLYTFWRRTVPYPSMSTFDAPSRETCIVKRARTNTPLQALITLNDPAFVEAAQGLARRIVRESGPGADERARFGLSLCLGRVPDAAQVQVLTRLYESELAHYRVAGAAALALATEPLGPLPEGWDAAELAAWTSVANILLNHDALLTKE